MYWWLVIESLSLEWFHGNCLFFFSCSIPFLFLPMKHKWTTKQTSKTKNAQKLRRCELSYCLVSVLKCTGHELRINWPQRKKLIIILICAEIAERSKIDFLPLTSTAGSRSLIEIFQKILFAQIFFKTLLVKKILPWTTKELWRLTRLSMRNFTIEYARA